MHNSFPPAAAAGSDTANVVRPQERVGSNSNPGATVSTAGRGVDLSHYPSESPVAGLTPYRGWTLCTFRDTFDESARPGFISGYVVRSDEEVRLLSVSRFMFTPTQERFEFLARHDFPSGLSHDFSIDAAMRVEANVIAHALAGRAAA